MITIVARECLWEDYGEKPLQFKILLILGARGSAKKVPIFLEKGAFQTFFGRKVTGLTFPVWSI